MAHVEPRGAVIACLLGLLSAGVTTAAWPQTPLSSSPAVFRVDPVAERAVPALPSGPLYWRVESAPAPFADPPADSGVSLRTEADGRAWLFTLDEAGARTPGMRLEAEIGPVPIPEAASYVLRLNRAGGPPGAKTSVHNHPGSEAFLVRSGRLCQRTSHGEAELGAGESMNGHEPGQVMQLTSCGEANLDQWVMFVLDAGQPFSSPASFD